MLQFTQTDIGKVKPIRVVTCLALSVVLLTVSACANNSNTANQENTKSDSSVSPAAAAGVDHLKDVKLTYYYPNPVASIKDVQLVQDAINKITQPAIHAAIELKPIDWGAYEQKMNVISAAGEEYDLAYTSPSSNNYYQNVAKGAFIPLDDLLASYAPKTKAAVPEILWNAAKVKGKLYGVVNYQIVAMPYGYSIPKQYLEKYQVDANGIKSYDDLTPYYQKWKEEHPALLYNKDGGDGFSNVPPLWGMDSVGGSMTPGWIRLDDPSLTVINQFESPEFKKEVERKRALYTLGIIPKDAAVMGGNDVNNAYKAGKYQLFTTGVGVKPGVASEEKAKYNGIQMEYRALSEPLITTSSALGTMTAISKTSKNPERAMMFLELLNTNKELYRLISYGIEGKHYNVVDKDNGVIELIKDSGYTPNTAWMFGNQFNGFYLSKEDVGNFEKIKQMNTSAKASPTLGFNFDAEPVKTEIAQTTSVYKEYKDILMSGTADPAKTLPEFLEKMRKAGADKIIAEKQKQIDEWKKTK
ncbi:ABC transporter substrate-binding protein [Paenibacillus sp. 32352]|uniref:ABC transporter substrate-binding protein n=1 Tax=Paenibacillus sp. 32352 TaxID=1969111 RepID=UPI0009AE3AAB|nr:ABC transporter substrate-binding protein [Paenibacillus sp. 32352]